MVERVIDSRDGGLLAHLKSLPPDTLIGFDRLGPSDREYLAGKMNGKADHIQLEADNQHWETILAACREAELKVVYLDGVDPYMGLLRTGKHDEFVAQRKQHIREVIQKHNPNTIISPTTGLISSVSQNPPA